MSAWDGRRLHHPGFFGFAHLDHRTVERGVQLSLMMLLLLAVCLGWPEDR